MINFLRALCVILSIGLLTACGGSIVGVGGTDGKYVNEALPDNATIYTAGIDKAGEKSAIVAGTESAIKTDLIWNSYSGIVPCSDIKGVDYYVGGEANGEISLPLAKCKYGCKYRPPHPNGSGWYWTRPDIWVDADYDKKIDNDFTQTEAARLADHCGVPFQIRQ